ncbi:MAG: FKBP-type peptidyl-prolyl cis-trans isomerase [Paludibacter sp.]|nr:FKBP-type peptidyl-prolyl cis-trans isomerase [Paludibacter sp.]
MKKIIILSAVICTMIAFVNCSGNKNAKSVKLNSENDSLSYTFGLSQGSQIRQSLMKNDSTGKYIDDFFAGLNAGLKAPKEDHTNQIAILEKQIGQSYATGQETGLFGDSTLTANYPLFRQGMINGFDGKDIQMSMKEAGQYLEKTMQKRQAEQMAAAQKKYEEEMEVKYKAEKEAGEKFIAQIAQKPGILKTPAGVYYEVLKKGMGPIPVDTSVVMVNYTGKLMNDTIFDSNAKSGKSVEFPVTRVIKGWTDALKIMPVGSKWRLYIPQELAYGASRQGSPIPPFSPLIFDVELVGIKKINK